MPFEFYNYQNVEFGVFLGEVGERDVALIPVDESVKTLLYEMVLQTRAAMSLDIAEINAIAEYEPSERYDASSRTMLRLTDELAHNLRAFYEMANVPVNTRALSRPSEVSAYFCMIHDHDDNKLVAVKRAAQFKAVLKNHLLRFIDDGLTAIEDAVFKLDSDFDLYIVDDVLHIKNVAAFEHMADIEEQSIQAARRNVAALERMSKTIGFLNLADYVASHKRAARIIAALRRRSDLDETSTTNLRRECRKAGIDVEAVKGRIVPVKGNEMAFLQMLDRRRYAVSLVPGRWEQYEASSRKGVGVRERQPAEERETSARAARKG